MANTNSATHVRVIEETPADWRVVFDYPAFNIVDASIFEALQDLLARIDAGPSLRVVVFEKREPRVLPGAEWRIMPNGAPNRTTLR